MKPVQDKLTTLEQMRSAAERSRDFAVDAALTAAEAEFITVSLPASAWKANTEQTLKTEGYNFMADAAVESLTSLDGAETEIAIGSRAVAVACGLAQIAHTQNGSIRYYAKGIPSAPLSLQVEIKRATFNLE